MRQRRRRLPAGRRPLANHDRAVRDQRTDLRQIKLSSPRMLENPVLTRSQAFNVFNPLTAELIYLAPSTEYAKTINRLTVVKRLTQRAVYCIRLSRYRLFRLIDYLQVFIAEPARDTSSIRNLIVELNGLIYYETSIRIKEYRQNIRIVILVIMRVYCTHTHTHTHHI